MYIYIYVYIYICYIYIYIYILCCGVFFWAKFGFFKCYFLGQVVVYAECVSVKMFFVVAHGCKTKPC